MSEVNLGLSFHIDMKLVGDVKTHFIKSALVGSHGGKPILNSFKYEVPESVPHGPRRLGASETLGIFGGVKDSAQENLSETVERNIGDALTLALMRFLVENKKDLAEGGQKKLLVLGPPIPKVIGRFASLRMPQSLGIGWFYCFPPPEWLASFPGWSIVSRAGHHLSRLWMEDELVVEDYKIVGGVEYRVAWMNQYIEYDNVYTDKWIEAAVGDLSPTPWVDANVRLPPVLALAALYALAERARSRDDRRNSPLEILAAASVEEEPSEEKLADRLDERLTQLQKLVNGMPDKESLQVARRGEEPLTVEDLPDLIDLWNQLKVGSGALPAS